MIVGGGDGSLSAAARVLAGTGAVLGVLPLGTANDFARTLRIPTDLAAASRVIARGRVRRIDLGWTGRHAFLNAASVGASSELTRRLDDRLKRRAGKLAYPVAGAAAAAQPPFRVRIGVDGRTEELDALQVVVGNGRYHGGGRLVAPDARVDDHLLDVYVLVASSTPGRARLRIARPTSRRSPATPCSSCAGAISSTHACSTCGPPGRPSGRIDRSRSTQTVSWPGAPPPTSGWPQEISPCSRRSAPGGADVGERRPPRG